MKLSFKLVSILLVFLLIITSCSKNGASRKVATADTSIQQRVVNIDFEGKMVKLYLDSVNGEGLQRLIVDSVDLGKTTMISIKDPENVILPELLFIDDTFNELRVLLTRVTDEDSTMRFYRDISITPLINQLIGESTYGEFTSFFSTLELQESYNVIILPSSDFSENTKLLVYDSDLDDVFIAVDESLTTSSKPGDVTHLKKAAPVKFVVGALLIVLALTPFIPMTIYLVDEINTLKQPVVAADFTGLTINEFRSLQYRRVAAAAAQTGNTKSWPGLIGKYVVKYGTKDLANYIDRIVVVNKPCNDPTLYGKIFSQSIKPGEVFIPYDQNITVFLCSTIGEEIVVIIPTDTPTQTATPKDTATPTLTPSPVHTSTPTSTLTPTITPTNTPLPYANLTIANNSNVAFSIYLDGNLITTLSPGTSITKQVNFGDHVLQGCTTDKYDQAVCRDHVKLNVNKATFNYSLN